jgi:hypothetical protein
MALGCRCVSSDDMVNFYELSDAFVMTCSSLELSVYGVETDAF